MVNPNPNSVFSDVSNQPVLVVVEQKGSDEIECKERVIAGYKVIEKMAAEGVSDIRFMVVGGANNGVLPKTIESWIPGKDHNKLYIDNKAGNTHEKALSIVDYVVSEKIKTIFQVTSLYHSLRAYLTTLKAFFKKDIAAPQFYNLVCDSDNLSDIHFAICDELLLAKSLNGGLKFGLPQNAFELVRMDNLFSNNDPGLNKYFHYRLGEAKRIAEYSEEGKNHLTTNINAGDILATYIVSK